MSEASGFGGSQPIGLDLARLAPHLRRHLPGCGPEVRATLLTGGRSNLTYEITDGAERWVLRRPPLGLVAPTANDVAREFRFLAALRATDVPVPDALWLCEDPSTIGAPFSIVSMVDGDVLRSASQTAVMSIGEAEGCATAIVAALAALHAVSLGHLALPGRPAGFLGRQLARWRGQWDVVCTRGSTMVDELHRSLARSTPAESDATIVHGDYRLDNVIVAPGDPATVAAVIDWEMATLGDPLADLGLLLVYWDPICEPVLGVPHPIAANPGFPSREQVAAMYGVATGRDLARLDWYVALGYFKLAVIAEGIHRRFVDGDTVGDGFENIGSAVDPLLAAGIETIGAHAHGN